MPIRNVVSIIHEANYTLNLKAFTLVYFLNEVSTLLTMLYAVFKILRLSPEQIELELNLRDLHHKQLNLNFSNNDVQWNHKDGWCRHCWARAQSSGVVLCASCRVAVGQCSHQWCRHPLGYHQENQVQDMSVTDAVMSLLYMECVCL